MPKTDCSAFLGFVDDAYRCRCEYLFRICRCIVQSQLSDSVVREPPSPRTADSPGLGTSGRGDSVLSFCP